ncbi:molecular chaperone DnaJ [Candidatus Peregrinibacteria bacterium CG_4_9_14_0_2_um_filter_53_11]|nr:MAG: molecular chaperone DnaJ [Candidatus Peregrinibacteria bacterium CG_4_9_14_0_2_um_filter_53_11]
MAHNLYDILGVERNATDADIKRAYRKLAQQYHPDKNKGDEASEKKFKEVTAAYEILSDKQKRTQYDQFGDSPFGAGGQAGGGFPGGFDFGGFGGGGAGNFSDIFETFFGGGATRQGRRQPSRGADREIDIGITFKEAAFGADKEVTVGKIGRCDTCDGSGAAKGSKVVRCTECGGSGSVQAVQQTILGQVSTRRPCTSCDGQGERPEKPCSTCGGSGRLRKNERLRVKIPAGIDSNSSIRLSGKGDSGIRTGENGDLYVNIHIEPDEEFSRRDADVYSQQTIHITQAVLGDTIAVSTIHGPVSMKIPAGTQSGKVFRLKEQGIPKMRQSGRGDHYVELKVQVPTKLSKSEREFYRKIAEENKLDIKEDKGFFGKILD